MIHWLPLTEHESDSEVLESMATQMIHIFYQVEPTEISGPLNVGGQLGKFDTHMKCWPEVRQWKVTHSMLGEVEWLDRGVWFRKHFKKQKLLRAANDKKKGLRGIIANVQKVHKT